VLKSERQRHELVVAHPLALANLCEQPVRVDHFFGEGGHLSILVSRGHVALSRLLLRAVDNGVDTESSYPGGSRAGGPVKGHSRTLAHHGVLFLDELTEFASATLEALRQPLEDGRVVIVRARHSATYPARFMLVAATNPCRCGYAGVPGRCKCSSRELLRYRRRLSGPLLDRIDLFPSLRHDDLQTLDAKPLTTSMRASELVLQARERQAKRFAEHAITVNAQMDSRQLREHVKLDQRSEGMLRGARQRGSLSVRGQHRAIRVARTIADLAHSDQVEARHLERALSLRANDDLREAAAA
jgi:magnesium chelatase family protein